MARRTALLLLVLACALGTLADLGSFYHTSDQLLAEFRSLAASCPGMTVGSRSKDGVELPTVRLASTSQAPKHRALLFFGEHARELISPESALAFVRRICSTDGDSKDLVSKIRAQADIMLFPNINLSGRKRVEAGEYCLRSNEHGVDLNRNWDAHWTDDTANKAALDAQSSGGRQPFSEVETQILKVASNEFRPTIFLTVHSGTLGMYMPYAYSGSRPSNKRDDDRMTDVLQQLNKQYCNCPAGPAGKEVGYLCPGTCLDYMYDQIGTKFSYGFEIFDGEKGVGTYSFVKKPTGTNLLQANEQVRSLSKSRERLRALTGGLGVFGKGPKSCFMRATADAASAAPGADHAEELHAKVRAEIQSQSQSQSHEHKHDFWFDSNPPADTDDALLEVDTEVMAGARFPEPRDHVARSCLSQFNPTTKEMYDQTLENWSKGYLDTIWFSMQEEQ